MPTKATRSGPCSPPATSTRRRTWSGCRWSPRCGWSPTTTPWAPPPGSWTGPPGARVHQRERARRRRRQPGRGDRREPPTAQRPVETALPCRLPGAARRRRRGRRHRRCRHLGPARPADPRPSRDLRPAGHQRCRRRSRHRPAPHGTLRAGAVVLRRRWPGASRTGHRRRCRTRRCARRSPACSTPPSPPPRRSTAPRSSCGRRGCSRGGRRPAGHRAAAPAGRTGDRAAGRAPARSGSARPHPDPEQADFHQVLGTVMAHPTLWLAFGLRPRPHHDAAQGDTSPAGDRHAAADRGRSPRQQRRRRRQAVRDGHAAGHPDRDRQRAAGPARRRPCRDAGVRPDHYGRRRIDPGARRGGPRATARGLSHSCPPPRRRPDGGPGGPAGAGRRAHRPAGNGTGGGLRQTRLHRRRGAGPRRPGERARRGGRAVRRRRHRGLSRRGQARRRAVAFADAPGDHLPRGRGPEQGDAADHADRRRRGRRRRHGGRRAARHDRRTRAGDRGGPVHVGQLQSRGAAPGPGPGHGRWAGRGRVVPRTASTRFPLAMEPVVKKGTLPRLRFGSRYAVRVMAVDLAGNSIDPALCDDARASEPVHFRRQAPVPCPVVVPTAPFTAGESLLRLVVRSDGGATRWAVPASATSPRLRPRSSSPSCTANSTPR